MLSNVTEGNNGGREDDERARKNAPEASVDAVASAPAPNRPRNAATRWVRRTADRVPTSWFAGIGTVLFLGATAAFGGLADVPKTPLPDLTAGESFVGSEIEFVPTEVFVVDEQRGVGVTPEEGQRVLVMLIDATNLGPNPRSTFTDGTPASVRAKDLPDVAPTLTRWDDGTLSPWLQPGVTAPLALAWAIDADSVADGDELHFTLPTADRTVGSFVVSGEYWSDLRVGAHLTLRVSDRGIGTAEALDDLWLTEPLDTNTDTDTSTEQK